MEINDGLQQRVVSSIGCSTLVLGGPGCGKTHLLAKRVGHAYTEYGVPFSEMLCVTFTNRAAREMRSRVEDSLGFSPEDLFIGNIHSFCLRFLYENGIIDSDTGILDEEDRNQYLSTLGLKTEADAERFASIAAAIYQEENDYPPFIRKAGRWCFSESDRSRYDAYRRFKEENRLIDFDDILHETYSALLNFDRSILRSASFSWLQVDEVQDLTPLQLAILMELTKGKNPTRLFFGDEQQAIFSFAGADGSTLQPLKNLCEDHIIHLTNNYRSSRQLIELCNTLATSWLGIDSEVLPIPVRNVPENYPPTLWRASAGNLRLLSAHTAREWLACYPEDKVLILTRTNREADSVSEILTLGGIEHFHISKQDTFVQPAFKTLWSHLAVLVKPDQYNAWCRLAYSTGAANSLAKARELTQKLRGNAISQGAMLKRRKQPIILLAELYKDSGKTITVIDTETTGLDVVSDEVVQIAAVKIINGEIDENSTLNIYLESSKPLPATLKNGTSNPLTELYAAADKFTREEGLNLFAEYLGDCDVIAGHNIEFDRAILLSGYKRYNLDIPEVLDESADCIDTMQISRLIFPRYRSYSLANLIERLNLKGRNTHLAIDDVMATAELLTVLAPLSSIKAHDVEETLSDPEILKIAGKLESAYGDFYRKWSSLLTTEVSIPECLTSAYEFFRWEGFISQIPHFNYIISLVDQLTADCEHTCLKTRLDRKLYDLLTFHESDLLSSGIIKEKLTVTTVHKAKGLECDNVIMHDASTRYGTMEEHARLLYVAFSRARKRLAAGLSCEPDGVINSFLYKFRELNRREIAVAVNCEAINLSYPE